VSSTDEEAGEGEYVCDDCDRAFDTKRGKNIHRSHVHAPPGDTECEVCGRDDFENERGKEIHRTKFHVNGPGRVAVTCERCGETFNAKPSHADRRRFCSMDCKGEWQSEAFSGPNGLVSQGKTLTFTCVQCGGSYERYLNRADRTRFCSKECEYQWRSENIAGEDHPMWNGGDVEFICVQCGDSFSDEPSSSRRFCSRSCYGEWRKGRFTGEDHWLWNGGHEDYYGPNWIAQREKARERDGHQCVICSLTDEDHIERHGCELHVHHIRRFASFAPFDRVEDYERANDLSNLITLCLPCHANTESMAPLLPQPGD
jgi:5-methylcytosine-specific restriction endonuclease McrA